MERPLSVSRAELLESSIIFCECLQIESHTGRAASQNLWDGLPPHTCVLRGMVNSRTFGTQIAAVRVQSQQEVGKRAAPLYQL